MSESQVTPRRYGGLAGEERQRRRREQLVVATTELVGEVGVAGLTVAAVCTRAGVSKRYFYEAFDSLDEVVCAALEVVLDAVVGSVGRSADAVASPDAAIEAAVRAALDALEEPHARRLYVEAAAVPAALATRERATQGLVDRVLQQVVGDAAATASAQLLGHVLVSGTTHVVAMWLRGELDLTREELVHHLVDLGVLAAAQLTGPAA